MLLAASGSHAREIALKRVAAAKFQTFSSVVLWKRDTPAIQRLGPISRFFGTQLQPLTLDANRRRDHVSAIANGARAGNLVVNILAAWIDILRKHELSGREANNRPDQNGPSAIPVRHCARMLR